MSRYLIFVGDYLPSSPFVQPAASGVGCVVANLEAAICETDGQPQTKAHRIIIDANAYRRIECSGVAAFNLANNHVFDAGADAFGEMLVRLSALKNLQFYGTRHKPYAELNVGGRRCLVIGCLERCRARHGALFFQEDVANLIRDRRPHVDRIYVTPHWGKYGELACYPSPAQQRLGRVWIKAGADGIFGHHSHTIHGCERIRNKPIYYSLGNYQFDHVEGREYPLAAWGLAVKIAPAESAPEPEDLFFYQARGAVVPASAEVKPVLQRHLHRISEDMGGTIQTCVNWARSVGPIYIAKSAKSWRKRFRANFLKTLPIWVAWNLLPTTILMRLATYVPSRDIRKHTEQTIASLKGAVPDIDLPEAY